MEGNHRQNQKQNFVLYAHISIHVMRDDVTVLMLKNSILMFIIRLCTSVFASCSQAFHCDDITLCVTLRTQFSTVFSMIVLFPAKNYNFNIIV